MSNIAWDPADDAAVAQVLLEQGVAAIEVAPTKAWADPRAASTEDAADYARRWRALGLEVVSTQALLFGRPDLQLFATPDARRDLVAHLRHVLSLGAAMGAKAQVFGSPKNRRREGLPAAEAFDIAADVFAELGAHAAAEGTCLCLEANPEQYGADFLVTAHEAAALVEVVDTPGLRLHLDTACMQLADDDVGACVERYAGILQHVHVSEPELGPVGERPASAHASLVTGLHAVGYGGTVSVEMRPASSPVDGVRTAAAYVSELVGTTP